MLVVGTGHLGSGHVAIASALFASPAAQPTANVVASAPVIVLEPVIVIGKRLT